MTFVPKTTYALADENISREDLLSTADWLGIEGALDGPDIGWKTTGQGSRVLTPIPWLTQGPLVKKFEEEFAARVGAKHAIFVNSGSSANLLATFLPIVMDRKAIIDNPRTILPAVAWATSVMPAVQFGLGDPDKGPVLCEADEDTWGLDTVALRKMCERSAPSIVLLVHVLGVPCKTAEIAALKEEFGFILIEDACGALGSQPVGKIGDLTTYSTFYGHQLSTIEGGFITTDNDAPAEILRSLREHGAAWFLPESDQLALAKKAGQDPFRSRFTFYRPGFNVRGTDLQAHLGLSQMQRADEVAAARRRNHAAYFDLFLARKDFAIQNVKEEVASIGFGVLASSSAHRARVAEALKAKGIDTRPIGGGNMARQPFWIAAYGASKVERPMANRIHDCGFQLPNHPGLTPEDVGYIAETVLAVKP